MTAAKTTIGVTAFLRPESLARFEESCAQWYPGVPVLARDTGGNLSRGRNQIVAQCSTPYLLFCDDDFEFCDAESLPNLAAILDEDSSVDLVGGRLRHAGEWMDYFGTMQHQGRDTLTITTPLDTPWRETSDSVPYRRTDLSWNFFLARTEFLSRHPWNEELELAEHAAYFWTLKEAECGVYYTPAARAIHHRDRDVAEFNRFRRRSPTFVRMLPEFYGWGQLNFHKTPSQRFRSDFEDFNDRCVARSVAMEFAIHFPDAMPCFGTLLGMVRENDVIAWDRDIDFAWPHPDEFPNNRHIGPFTIENVYHHFGDVSEIAYRHESGHKVDLFYCLPAEDRTSLLAVYPDEFPAIQTAIYTVSDEWLEPDERVVWGHRFRFPANPEAILKAIYGDWRIPVRKDQHRRAVCA